MNRPGFTLIELLVVLTIIIVLLALLTPSLDNAVYHAELAVCGAQMRSLALGAVAYAVDHRRTWPVRTENYNWDALTIRLPPLPAGSPPYDLRRTVGPYLGAETFVDPLCGGIDLRDGANRDDTVLYANMNVYFGWGIAGYRSMRKMGDRFTWTEPGTDRTWRFNALAGDRDSYRIGEHAVAGHADDAGKLQFIASQAGSAGTYTSTHSHWQKFGWEQEQTRGLIDANYSFDDGSVGRFMGAAINDDRLVQTPTYNDGYYASGYVTQLPPEN
jgi:prepilin-type N-terminal cleavage/methylation domain-containing protein